MANGVTPGDVERPRRRWVWWLLLLLVALSALAARWGYQHIETQVQTAAPEMLRVAGIDPEGLTFDARYRDVTVAGNLPEGVTASEVREILEQRRGSNGADIRHARVVAAEWVGREPKPAGSVMVKPIAATERDTKSVETSVGAVSPPRVNVLLGDGQLTLSGSDISTDQIQHLLNAATAAVGAENVVQQWQSSELPGQMQGQEKDSSVMDEHIAQVEPLGELIAALGDKATAARVTLEDNIVHGSIEAISERSLQQLKPLAGEAVVVTATVAVQQTEGAQEAPADAVPASTTQTVNTDDVANTSASTDDEVEGATDTAQTEDAPAADTSENAAAQSEEDELQAEIAALQAEIDALQREIDKPVFFVHDSSAITREAMPLLDNVAAAMQRYQRPAVLIDGHTDSLASRQYNLRLSKQRAASVVRYLTSNGVDASRLRSEGYGEDRPVTSNKTKPGRRLNRRVEFTARRPFTDADQ